MKALKPEKMATLQARCSGIAEKALSWDIPVEKASEAVEDLCPPPTGQAGGGHIPIRIRGTNDGSVPEGGSAFVKVDSPVNTPGSTGMADRLLKLYGPRPFTAQGASSLSRQPPALPLSVGESLRVFTFSPLTLKLPTPFGSPVGTIRPLPVTAP